MLTADKITPTTAKTIAHQPKQGTNDTIIAKIPKIIPAMPKPFPLFPAGVVVFCSIFCFLN